MQFFILGASGLLGGQLVQLLGREGIEWLGAGRRSGPTLIEFDLARDRLLDRASADWFTAGEKVWIVHGASFGSIDACFHRRKESWEVNVEGLRRVIDELRPFGVRHVFLSTNQVFDGEQSIYREEDRPRPLNEYGRQKLAMEGFLLESVPGSLILRLDKVVSDRRGDGQLFDQWRRNIEAREPIRCLPGRFSPTLASDVAAAILTACRRGLEGLYHVANPEPFERRRLAELFLEVMGAPGEIRMVSEEELNLTEPRPRSAVLDSSKFLSATGMTFTPARAMLERLRDA